MGIIVFLCEQTKIDLEIKGLHQATLRLRLSGVIRDRRQARGGPVTEYLIDSAIGSPG